MIIIQNLSVICSKQVLSGPRTESEWEPAGGNVSYLVREEEEGEEDDDEEEREDDDEEDNEEEDDNDDEDNHDDKDEDTDEDDDLAQGSQWQCFQHC